MELHANLSSLLELVLAAAHLGMGWKNLAKKGKGPLKIVDQIPRYTFDCIDLMEISFHSDLRTDQSPSQFGSGSRRGSNCPLGCFVLKVQK